jgi:type I restriction enzyme S subunit
VYGYLRPYLNKVWLADVDGYCSVDQYVFVVDETRAEPAYVAHFMRSTVFLDAAPIDYTPGQLPRIRTQEVLRVPIALPSLADQRQVATRLDAELELANQARKAASASAEAAEILRAALLRRAFERERERGS